jgi:hypothetical protein
MIVVQRPRTIMLQGHRGTNMADPEYNIDDEAFGITDRLAGDVMDRTRRSEKFRQKQVEKIQ